MQKIPTLFVRNHGGDQLVRDELNSECAWVVAGEGVATEKFDGTACMVRDSVLYKRYDRKPSKAARRKHAAGEPWRVEDLKDAPDGWEPCGEPDLVAGHWPGWVRVGDGPEDQYHREAFQLSTHYKDGTYELLGPKIQGNPYGYHYHVLMPHGWCVFESSPPPIRFEDLRNWLTEHEIEGIVWHHPDGRMAKIKRRDFDLSWPDK